MRSTFETRLVKLEQQAQAADLPQWDAVDAALERLRTAVRAQLGAALDGSPVPEHDVVQAHADTTLLTRWSVSQGVSLPMEGARERLSARLMTLAARHKENDALAL